MQRCEFEQFFLSAVLFEKKDVRIEGWSGPKEAEKIIAAAQKAFEAKHGAR
jgi:inorganic pyrophosphatase